MYCTLRYYPYLLRSSSIFDYIYSPYYILLCYTILSYFTTIYYIMIFMFNSLILSIATLLRYVYHVHYTTLHTTIFDSTRLFDTTLYYFYILLFSFILYFFHIKSS